MSQLQDRIGQFRKMASEDPDNELGHFRLGQLLMEAGQLEEAAASFRRTLELSPQFAKVFQLLGSCLIDLGKKEEAVKVLRDGWKVADEHGHVLPRDEMAKLLEKLGEPVPESRKPILAEGAASGFRCQRPGCGAGSRARPLERAPINDDLGKRIQAAVCADCWDAWLKVYSVKLVNENYLDLSREDHQKMYDQVMREFLGFE